MHFRRTCGESVSREQVFESGSDIYVRSFGNFIRKYHAFSFFQLSAGIFADIRKIRKKTSVPTTDHSYHINEAAETFSGISGALRANIISI